MFSSQSRPVEDREWRGVIGLDKERFSKLEPIFDSAFRTIRGGDIHQIRPLSISSEQFAFQSTSDLLFFILLSLKSGLTFDILSFLYDIHQSNAKRNHNLGLEVLHLALESEGCLPVRNFDTVAEFHGYFQSSEVLIIDATEQLVQRPEGKMEQKEYYSGKRKAHTHKVMIISTLDRYIHFVSEVYTGRLHDYTILKEEFPPEEAWFIPFQVRIDLGYQGFESDYPGVKVFIPHKKPRKSELSQDQKQQNKELASERILVEHSIGGMKRYEAVSGKSRSHDIHVINLVMACCAGLWNFYLTH